MERPTTFWKPDLSALRDTKVTLIVGIGEHSGNELCDRTSQALAAEIGITPTMFPGVSTVTGTNRRAPESAPAWLALAGLAAILLSDLSGLSKAETERI